MKTYADIRNEFFSLRGAVQTSVTEADYIKLNKAIKDVYDFCMSRNNVDLKLHLHASMTFTVQQYKVDKPDWYAKYVLTEDNIAMFQKLDFKAKAWRCFVKNPPVTFSIGRKWW